MMIVKLLSRLTRRLFRTYFEAAEKKRRAEEQAREEEQAYEEEKARVHAEYLENWRRINEHLAELRENNNKETSQSDESKNE